MSEVKRYGHIGYLVNASDRLCELYPDMTVYVKASDYDAAQSELAALREELSSLREEIAQEIRLSNGRLHGWADCGVKLTAAEQRNAELVKAATAIADEITNAEIERGRVFPETYKHPGSNRTEENGVTVTVRLLNRLRAALKPTESGASE